MIAAKNLQVGTELKPSLDLRLKKDLNAIDTTDQKVYFMLNGDSRAQDPSVFATLELPDTGDSPDSNCIVVYTNQYLPIDRQGVGVEPK